ncbi:MAG: glycosyltransferase family 2 protein [Deltaproteobacteria bacterium]|nr:glycosyltransferase family 2 protein [Deltaproteobacteria bacterium]
MSSKVSAIIITQNEAESLQRCLEGLQWCDEIVIVDSESRDETVELARKYTDKIFIEAFKGFGPQKQSAVEKTSNEWVLSIDADEEVTPLLAEEIASVLEQKSPIKGFLIPRKNLYGSKWIRFGGQYPDYNLRLFSKSHGEFTRQMIHERIIVSGEVAKLSHPLIHYAYKDLSTTMQKMNRYTNLAAEEKWRQGERVTFPAPLLHLITHFLKDYFLRFGFLDGHEGFIVTWIKSLSAYFKYAKLLEFQKMGRVD